LIELDRNSMSEKDREPGSDAPGKASERETAAPAGAAKESAGAPDDAAAGGAVTADAATADAAKAEARAQAIAAAKAKAEATRAAKAAAAGAGAGDAAGSGSTEAPAGGGAPAGDAQAGDADAAKAEARAKAVAAAKAKAEAAKAAKPKAAEGAAKPKHGEPAGDQPPWMVDPVPPTWKDESEDQLVKALQQEHPGAIIGARSASGDLALTTTREGILAIATSLKERHGFRYLVDVAGVDFPTRPERFEVVYHVYNHSTERRVRLKVSTDEATPVPSLCGVWRGVNWPEREAYDMFGIRFAGHPDLTRILLWEGFNGYPLRKEFPVEGIDTGSAIYPEYYDEGQGPISGTGTGWKPPKPAAGGEGDAGGGGGEPGGKAEEAS
jgi:NADH-quinone oxidoreductase subunit C